MGDFMVRCNITQTNIFELLQEGIISCVLYQDWSVNRILPDFFDYEKFRIKLAGERKLLHLGIGDGECCRYFNKNPYFSQFSISDRLYIDPSDIILYYLKKCNISEKIASSLSEIMRNEFLISLSAERLSHTNEDFYDEKDYYICELLKKEFITQNNYSYSYNVLLLLIHILNTDSNLLLPSYPIQRLITPMGNHVVFRKITIPYSLYREKLTAFITIDDVARIAMDKFSNVSGIYLGKFENSLLSENLKFDYIFSVRSDAFLKEKYIQFVLHIVKHLKLDGFYISDGIVCSYSYELFYNELKKMITILGQNRIFLVKAKQSCKSFPLREICGIIVLGEKANIKNIYSFISNERLISANRLLNNESFLRQCIWSDLYAWATSNKIDLEIFEFDEIVNIIDKYVDLKKKNQYFSSMFDSERLFLQNFI